MEINFLQAALIRILYYMTLCSPPWLTGIVHVSIRQPLVSGTIVGLILGDPQNGLIIGATINTVVLGFLNVGGAIPSDPGIAGVVGTSLAIATGATPEVAVTIAVSFGLVGTIVWNLRSTINSVFVHMVDSAAAQGDMKKIYFVQFVLVQIATFCISAVPVFGILYFGTDVATQVLDALKGTPMQILTVIGQILPAMGIAIILRLLSNRPNIIQLFMLGFVLSIYGNVPMIVIAVVAFIIASLYADLKFNRAKEEV